MKKSIIVVALMVIATAEAPAGQRPFLFHGSDTVTDDYVQGYGYSRRSGANYGFKNAPGGAYIDCDPRNPSSPIRCRADGW